VTVHSVSSNYQTLNAMNKELKNFSTQLNALQGALNSGNQDQVASSKNTFSTTLNQVMSDLSAVTQVQPTGSGNQVKNTGNGRVQNLQNDLKTLQNALSSVNPQQGASSQDSLANALSKVQSDIAGIQKGHGHHQHQHSNTTASTATNSGNGANNNDTLSALAALFGKGGQSIGNGSSVNIQA
jgi:ElaB/YqjD/DUF883 family membrane-anchored ribosome-binding protein